MLWTAQPCGCTHDSVMGKKRPRKCECGNVFVRPTERAGKPRKALRRIQPKRDWTDARAKVEQEGCCRICKRSDRPLEACHVLGREHDEPKVSKETGEILKELYVHPDRIFPGCGPFPEGCHGDVDMRRINVLPYLTLEEQLQAVKDAGGIAVAAMRLAPVDHREEVEASRVVAA
jgi:hypothetical protein